jgi:hypothetical protein
VKNPLSIALIVSIIPAIAHAQDGTTTTIDKAAIDTTDWTLKFQPSAWYAAPGGKIRMPGSPESIGMTRLENLNLDSARVSPYMQLHWRNGDWRVSLSTSYVSERDRSLLAREDGFLGPIQYATSDQIKSSLSVFNLELTAARKIDLPDSLTGNPTGSFSSRLEAMGGLRFQHFDADFETHGADVSANEAFGFPVVGLRYSMEIVRRFSIDVHADFGGFAFGGGRSAWGTDIVAGFQYRPLDNLGVEIGYRLMSFHTRTGRGSDRYQYDGALAGIFFGAVLKF